MIEGRVKSGSYISKTGAGREVNYNNMKNLPQKNEYRVSEKDDIFYRIY